MNVQHFDVIFEKKTCALKKTYPSQLKMSMFTTSVHADDSEQ